MKLSFLEPARQELDDAFEYYEAEQQELGTRFISEINATLARITDFPEAYQLVGVGRSRVRRALVGHFPFGIMYQYQKESRMILIVAVAHLHRKPDYWLSRQF